MNVQDVITRVSRVFGDDAQVQVTSDDIIRWINDAQRTMADDDDLFKVTGSITATANTYTYTLPTDLYSLHSFKFNGVTLRSLSQQEADSYIANNDADSSVLPVGVPTHYWIWGNTVHLYPTPSQAGTLNVYYQRAPVDVVNPSDSLDIPLVYHNAVVDYCLVQAYALDDNLYAYQVRRNYLDTDIKNLKENSEWDRREYYPFIGSSTGDTATGYEGYIY